MASDVDGREGRSVGAGQVIRIVVVVAVVALLALWALANDSEVEVDWVFDTTRAPLVVVIVASAAAGFLVGLLAGWRRH